MAYRVFFFLRRILTEDPVFQGVVLRVDENIHPGKTRVDACRNQKMDASRMDSMHTCQRPIAGIMPEFL